MPVSSTGATGNNPIYPNTFSVADLNPLGDLSPLGALPGGEVERKTVAKPTNNDRGLADIVRGDYMGMCLDHGSGEAKRFAQMHSVSSGRLWDFHDKQDVLELSRRAAGEIKKTVSGTAKINALSAAVESAVKSIGESILNDADLNKDLEKLNSKLGDLKATREKFVSGIDDSSLSSVRKTLRAFRYRTQVALAKHSPGSVKMGFGERAVRWLQNKFTFGAGCNVGASDFEEIARLEKDVSDLLGSIAKKAGAKGVDTSRLVLSEDLSFMSTIKDALELSHTTNDRIRSYKDHVEPSGLLRDMLGDINEYGGEREVELTVGLGAMLKMKLADNVQASAGVGASYRVSAKVSVPEKGGAVEVTYKYLGTVDAKVGVQASFGSEKSKTKVGVQGHAQASGGAGVVTTRKYASMEDFYIEAGKNKLAVTRSLSGFVLDVAKSVFRRINIIGTAIGRWAGRRSDDVVKADSEYLKLMGARDLVGRLDRELHQPKNAYVVMDSSNYILEGQLGAGGGASFANYVNANLDYGFKTSGDCNMKSSAFLPLVDTMILTPSDQLSKLLRPPAKEGEPSREVPMYNTAKDVLDKLDATVEKAKKNPPGNRTSWAELASELRTLIIAAEHMRRRGVLDESNADFVVNSITHSGVEFPEDTFREYFMDGAGIAKSAKSRDSHTVSLDMSVLSNLTEQGLENAQKGVNKSVLKGNLGGQLAMTAAGAGMGELRHQLGVDTKVKYSYESEEPMKDGEDPRPWENTKKTTHELTITGSLPARFIIDMITKSMANKGGPAARSTKDMLMETGKEAAQDAIGTAIADFVIANVASLIAPVSDDDDSGPSPVSYDFERFKRVRWNCVDGKLASITVFTGTDETIGFKFEPKVGLGLSVDFSLGVETSTRDRKVLLNPPLTTLLATAEDFLFASAGTVKGRTGDGMKAWIADNYNTLRDALSPERLNSPDNQKIYDATIAAASRDTDTETRVRNAWDAMLNFPAKPENPDDDDKAAFAQKAYEFLRAVTASYHIPETMIVSDER